MHNSQKEFWSLHATNVVLHNHISEGNITTSKTYSLKDKVEIIKKWKCDLYFLFLSFM